MNQNLKNIDQYYTEISSAIDQCKHSVQWSAQFTAGAVQLFIKKSHFLPHLRRAAHAGNH